VHAWIFRHRHGLRSIYGLPPEPRLAGLIARARGAERRPTPTGDHARDHDARSDDARSDDAAERARVRQLTIRPHPRRA